MTIDCKLRVVVDVFSENDFYMLERNPSPCDRKLGAALKIHDNHLDFLDFSTCYAYAFEEIISLIKSRHQEFMPWLLLSRRAPSSSKIARHKKLWKSFGQHPLPQGEKTSEFTIEENNFISFYGAILLERFNSIQIAKAIGRGKYGCIAITKNKNNEINKILQTGWGNPVPHNYGFPEEIIDFAYFNNIFFLRPIGAFDDREWGAVTLAQSLLIKEVFS